VEELTRGSGEEGCARLVTPRGLGGPNAVAKGLRGGGATVPASDKQAGGAAVQFTVCRFEFCELCRF